MIRGIKHGKKIIYSLFASFLEEFEQECHRSFTGKVDPAFEKLVKVQLTHLTI